jgi:4'-phosphopantetheinyl transferase
MANTLPRTRVATRPALADDELHVWRASLDLFPELLHRVENTLNANEKERAGRFLVPQGRERFLAGRGILRDLLGMYLEIGPGKVELSYGSQGKPSLSSVHNSKICFSVSHSQGMGLFVFARGSEIGVDIEEVKPDFRGMEIASHFFSGEEIAGLAKLPPTVVNEAFFGCWTRKEAYVKARGKGLSIPLRSFTVSSSAKEQSLRDEKGTVWSCYALEPAQGFSGAVVAAGENWKLRYYDWLAEVETAAPALLQPSDDCGGAD